MAAIVGNGTFTAVTGRSHYEFSNGYSIAYQQIASGGWQKFHSVLQRCIQTKPCGKLANPIVRAGDQFFLNWLPRQFNRASEGGLVLFKFGHRTAQRAKDWAEGDFMLWLPNKNSPKANWAQNSGRLREQMRSGKPIKDSHVTKDGKQIPTGGFLNAERKLLESRGWAYDPKTGAYYPPLP